MVHATSARFIFQITILNPLAAMLLLFAYNVCGYHVRKASKSTEVHAKERPGLCPLLSSTSMRQKTGGGGGEGRVLDLF